MLAHRLGLIPLLADPADFEERGEEDIANENNTIGAYPSLPRFLRFFMRLNELSLSSSHEELYLDRKRHTRP